MRGVPDPSTRALKESIQLILVGVFPIPKDDVPFCVQFVVVVNWETSLPLKNVDVLLEDVLVKCTLGLGKLPALDAPQETPKI